MMITWPIRSALITLGVLLCGMSHGLSNCSSAEPPITSIAFAPDQQTVLTISQSGLALHRWPDLKRIGTIQVGMSNLNCLAFSNRGDQLAVGGGNPSEDGLVEIFSWPQGKSIASIDQHLDSVADVDWVNGKRLLSAGLDRQLHVLDVAGGSVSASFAGHSRAVAAVLLLPDGNTLVSAGADQTVRVWELESGKLIRSLSQHTGGVRALALRPSSDASSDALPLVASAAGDRTVRFWQPTIGRMVRYIRLESDPLDIAWSRDGTQVFAACTDGSVRVIDPLNVKVIKILHAIEGWAYAIAVHPSDQTIAVGGSDGQIVRLAP